MRCNVRLKRLKHFSEISLFGLAKDGFDFKAFLRATLCKQKPVKSCAAWNECSMCVVAGSSKNEACMESQVLHCFFSLQHFARSVLQLAPERP